MKKKLIRIWGIGLTLVLAASLLLSAAPVSAGTLSWGDEDLPDEFVDTAGDDIVDLAISGDGSVIYAAIGGSTIYRSTNGGESWSSITVIDGTTYLNADFIAVTPDDPNYLAVAADNATVFISDDAGANWDTLNQIDSGSTIDAVWDLAISVEKGGNHFVGVVGSDGGADAEMWYYEIGAVGAQWEDAEADMGATDTAKDDDVCAAVAFSPNFYSDQAMVAVTFDAAADQVNFSMYSFNTNTWNSGAFVDFPKNLQQSSETLTSIEAASIAMAPDYLGSDDAMRIAFVGLALNGTSDMESEGIMRMDNTDIEVLKDEEAIYSIAFDGSLLVAGHYSEITIYRSTDALDDSPSVSSSTGSKEPGGENLVVVGIAGSTVVAGTSGAESAFAYSEDNGKTFNDLSLIDTALTTLGDVAVTPDGEKVYLVSCNSSGNGLSVWLYEERWERIYNKAGDDDFIIRIAPDDPDVVYLADSGGTDIYFSSDGGQEKWHTRVYKETSGVVDMAVETDGDTVYVLTTSGYVSKSTNRGFVWDAKKSSKLSGGSSMIASIGEDLLVAGSSDGYVSYSTDGNVSWSKLDDDLGGMVQVTATGLADGDMIIASANASTAYISQWELGEDDEWDAITDEGDIPSGYNVTGIGLFEGVLYAVSSNVSGNASMLMRTLTPTSDDPTWSTVDSAGERFEAAPKSLVLSASGDITKLWAIDIIGPYLFSYKDSLAVAGVTVISPADKKSVPFNRVSGEAEQVIFTWESPSDKVTTFDFEIATDSGFDEDVLTKTIAKSSGSWDEGDIISQIVGPGAASSDFAINFMENTTYYWRVRVNASGPVRSNYSEVRSFTLGSLPEAVAPVVVEQAPAPVIEVPPSPAITLQPPEIVLPAPQAAPEIVIPSAPEPTPPVPTWAIYAIIIIGAVLVIALIVLIMRTRRPV